MRDTAGEYPMEVVLTHCDEPQRQLSEATAVNGVECGTKAARFPSLEVAAQLARCWIGTQAVDHRRPASGTADRIDPNVGLDTDSDHARAERGDVQIAGDGVKREPRYRDVARKAGDCPVGGDTTDSSCGRQASSIEVVPE